MVQKDHEPGRTAPKRRGRPRAYDADVALRQAIDAFWKTGYSGTSLDDLSVATDMNRPSLYAAFGDKKSLYLSALERYWQSGFLAMDQALSYELPLKDALLRVYEGALSMYFSGNSHPRGCFAIGTAATEAVEDIEIRAAFAGGLQTLDEKFAARIKAAKQKGELLSDVDTVTLAAMASATLHSIAIRARAGADRAELTAMARRIVRVICAAPAASAKRHKPREA